MYTYPSRWWRSDVFDIPTPVEGSSVAGRCAGNARLTVGPTLAFPLNLAFSFREKE
jgi:hypothetical protein